MKMFNINLVLYRLSFRNVYYFTLLIGGCALGMKIMSNFGSIWNVVSLPGGCYIVQFMVKNVHSSRICAE